MLRPFRCLLRFFQLSPTHSVRWAIGTFVLGMEDEKHPNPNGSYLASCIIFSHLSAESSLNLSKRYKGVDNKGVDIYYSIVEDEVLTFIQQISDEVIF